MAKIEESDCSDTCKKVKTKNLRNLVGFWMLGLCNNYGYVIMLSAAFDLLNESSSNNTKISDFNETKTSNESIKICNPISTGAILLADILPALCIKFLAPMITISTNIRVILAVCLSLMSFIMTSLEVAHWMTFTGVVCAALSSGLGEVTFLSFSSYFDKDVVSTWSSGTGGAGVIGALSYASLRHALSVKHTLQVMLIMPVLMAVTFWIIIVHPHPTGLTCNLSSCGAEAVPMLSDSIDMTDEATKDKNRRTYTFHEKLSLIRPLLKYMIPLSLVYFAEYFINQGLMELLYFKNASSWLNHNDQYRWYQVDYQIGVLISRSSVNIFQIKRLWVLPILQIINVVFLLFETYYSFLPSIWIVFVIILYEGLLGGSAYVNTFYRISHEIPQEHREFSMGIASLGDSIGIAMAGVVALPVHQALCSVFDG